MGDGREVGTGNLVICVTSERQEFFVYRVSGQFGRSREGGTCQFGGLLFVSNKER